MEPKVIFSKLVFLMAMVMATAHKGCEAAVTDVDILNFALNLEYLEANFYSCAAYGRPLSSSLAGHGPAPSGCQKANLSPEAWAYARAIAEDEINHVKFLRWALGSKAVQQPKIDIGGAFAAAANAALNTTLKTPFTPYGSDIVFYHGAFIFEDVGVTAYKGAARLLANKDYLEAAAGILAVEAYHAGSIRTLLFQEANKAVFPYGARVKDIIQAISNLRAAVSNAADDMGIVDKQGNFIVAPTDKYAIAFSRSAQQVLNIVYLGGKGKGGFFPNGLNGNIH